MAFENTELLEQFLVQWEQAIFEIDNMNNTLTALKSTAIEVIQQIEASKGEQVTSNE